MEYLSFDVGIKNMAYCILDLSGEKMEITDWNVLNLLNLQTFVQKKCTVKCKTSKKKNEEKVLCVSNGAKRVLSYIFFQVLQVSQVRYLLYVNGAPS